MAAVACLRVLAEEAGVSRPDGLVSVVAKLTTAFLETRWIWPRRHGRVAPSAFLLADPRALELDAEELCNLARELQFKLFGVEAGGEVSLLLFEGGQAEITRFATCETAALLAALEGAPDAPPLNGRIRRITGAGVEPVAHAGDPGAAIAASEPCGPTVTPEELLERVKGQGAERPAAEPATAAGFHAIYHAPRQGVVGSAVSDGRLGASSLRGVFANAGHLQGDAARRYDQGCLEACADTLARPFGGLLYFPISFSSIVHRPTRELYLPFLDRLPPRRRGQLATAVYDVPRDPAFTAMSQLTAFLRTYFDFIDLQVTDPGFRVEKLQAGVVNSVTMVLTGGEQQARLSMAKRFMDNRDNYKRQKIWPALSHIRSRAELDYCMAQRAPFLSGPAVSDLLDAPGPAGLFPSAQLPLRKAAAPVLRRA